MRPGRLLVYKTHTLAQTKLSRCHRGELGGMMFGSRRSSMRRCNRHRFASRLVMAGVDLRTVAR